jgi:glucose/arabinose dehydrogenase
MKANPLRTVMGIVLGTATMLAARDVSAITLPSGFTEFPVASGLSNPTAMAFAPDGRLFVCQQGGSLRVIRNGSLLPTPFLTVSVDSSGERGLLGVAFDPDFTNNQYVYIYYTPSTPNLHRVSRFTAAGDVASGGETVILTIPDASSASNHNGGAMKFARDGTLMIAVGERAQSSNSQTLGNLLGKLLRINPDGTIPTDNPFYNTATGNNRAIWALGLRNPFTFDIHPTTGRLWVNDVGGGSWEEINEGVAGANYGWPTTEGYTSDPRYRSPLYAYSHSEGCAIIGAAFYAPSQFHFPASYTDTYFFADLCSNWIRNVNPANGNAVTTFATQTVGTPVDLDVGPDGNLYYLARSGGVVRRIAHTAGSPPVVTTPPASQTVALDESVTFSVAVSGTAPFTYQWQRNGTDILGQTSSSYTLSMASALDSGARFRCRISNAYGTVTSAEATLTVINSRRPQASIDTPTDGALYNGGDTVSFSGSASDPEDGPLGGPAFTWQVDFHHDTHTHPHVPAMAGTTSGSFTVPVLGETSTNVWFRIHLWAVDSAGLSRHVYRDVRPRIARVTLATDPSGMTVNVDGGPAQTAPYAFDSVVGMTRSIGTATSQVIGSNSYAFVSWSDGGAATHDLTVPSSPTTRTATFRATPENDVAVITIPAPGSALPSSATFTWTTGTGVSQYWLSVGTTQDGSQIWGGSTGTARSQTVSGIPQDGRAIYVRLQFFRLGTWQASYATYTGGAATATPTPTPRATVTPTPSSSIAQFTSPAPGSTLGSSMATFTWSPGSGVAEYWLSIGTTQDGGQIWAGSTATRTSQAVSGLPTDGRTVYARIQSLRNGVWQASYASYATGGGPAPTPTPTPTPSSSIAQMTSPTPGSTLTSSTVTFSWSAGTGVSQYWLSVGTTPGGSQLWGGSTGMARSQTVTGIPIDGRTIYTRVQSFTGGAWPASDATYATAGGVTPTPTPTPTATPGGTPTPSDIAQITSPTSGTRLTSSTATFSWSPGTGVSEYWLSVGTTLDGSQVWGGSTGMATSRTISGLPTDGRTVYVRIQSHRDGAWPASYASYPTGP